MKQLTNGHFKLLKAIIFDFDGVILESADIKTQAFLDLFATYPHHQDAILAYHLENLSASRYLKFEWIYRELLQQPYTEAEREWLGNQFSALVLEKILACPFVPGASEALQALHGHVKLFVASGTPQDELEDVVQRRGLAGRFDEVWGTPRVKTEIIEDILVRHNLDKHEAVMVGDGLTDYQAASAVGIPFIARQTPDAIWWTGIDVCALPDLWQLPAVLATMPFDDHRLAV